MPYVYLIKSLQSNWIYVGSTVDIARRLDQHNKGQVRSTKNRKPYVLVYSERFETIGQARQREKLIKDKRILKEKIIKLALSSNG